MFSNANLSIESVTTLKIYYSLTKGPKSYFKILPSDCALKSDGRVQETQRSTCMVSMSEDISL